MNLCKNRLPLLSIYFVGVAVVLLQACSSTKETNRDKLCGNWISVNGEPDVVIFHEGNVYKVTVFRRAGITRTLRPETFLLKEENGNLFINTGFRIDIAYNEATDVLTFSPHGDYTRVGVKQ
jgi:hypothetical protein